MALPRSVIALLSFVVAISQLVVLVSAQGTSPSASPVAASTSATAAPTVVPSTALYTYMGCYNETTGYAQAGNVRALSEGNKTATDAMTISYCLTYCGAAQYAGIEYGRECYCSPYLNSLSTKLPDDKCTVPCAGDATQVCGGSLALTLYVHKNATSGGCRGMGVGMGGLWGGVGLGMAAVVGGGLIMG